MLPSTHTRDGGDLLGCPDLPRTSFWKRGSCEMPPACGGGSMSCGRFGAPVSLGSG
jgi:hypothetical protein